MALVVGLTGGIASGKTTVANLFHDQFGIELIDADVIAREVVAPGSDGLDAIVERFGETILDDGKLNRAALREKVFSDETHKNWLNQLLHPMIRQRMLDEVANASGEYCLLIVPLLVENGLNSLCDRVLVVDVSAETQISRTVARDQVSETQVQSILKAQASRQQRLAIADDVIDNDQANIVLIAQVTELHEKYLAICRQNRSK